MGNEWMDYTCGERRCRGSNTKEAFDHISNSALAYYKDEIDSVIEQAQEKLSATFVNVYDRVIDLLAMANKPDANIFQVQSYYREIIDLLQDPEKQNDYAFAIQEDIASSQDAALEATFMWYPSVIVSYMGSKPARVMKPRIRVPNKNEFTTGISFGGSSLIELITQTTTDTFSRYIRKLLEESQIPDVSMTDFTDSVNDMIDVIDSAVENISTTEIMYSARQASQRINQLNPGVVKAFKRIAVIDNKTCVGCLALHGKLYSNQDQFESHPRCRCMLVPVSVPWVEYSGVQGGAVPNDLTRDQLLSIIPRSILEDILGPGRMALYDSGVSLDRMIYIEQTDEYGLLIRITPLSALREHGIS